MSLVALGAERGTSKTHGSCFPREGARSARASPGRCDVRPGRTQANTLVGAS